MSLAKIADILKKSFNGVESLAVADIAHKRSHAGDRWYVMYSVADLGAMTTPNDTITLTLKTPVQQRGELHFTFAAFGTAGWRIRLIEAPTGGGASPTGTLDILHHNRVNKKPSYVSDGTTEEKVSYDATLATGGVTLWDQYLEGSGGPMAGGTSGGARNEIELMYETVYQVSLYGTDNTPGTLLIDWYIE